MNDTIVKLQDVSFSYPTGEKALNLINLELPAGKKIAILGGNGAGKSTLMLLLNGILKPTSGYLEYGNKKYNYNKKALRELRSKIGLLFPEPDYQLIAPTVYEEISFGLLNQFKDEALVRLKVEKTIDNFSLHDIIDKPPHQLSTGQKKRVCLAAILAMEPELIVCDEPASNLDPVYANSIFKYLEKLNKKGKTILISTHDVNNAYSWADYIIVMSNGKILESGLPDVIFKNKEMLQKANLNQPMIIELLNVLGLDNLSEKTPKNIDDLKIVIRER